MNTILSRQLVLERQFDGPVPHHRRPQLRQVSAAPFPHARMVTGAIARRRGELSAEAAAFDPALLRMSGFLTEAVLAVRGRASGNAPAQLSPAAD